MAEPNRKSTFIEEARRKQLIETTIRTVARQGFANTTLADIARAAGVSTGVIAYHFQGKDDLIEQCIRALFDAPNAYVVERVDRADGWAEKLRTYIASNIQFMRENREQTIALTYSFSYVTAGDTHQRFSAKQHARIRKYVARILEEGQRAGEFRPFAATAVAELLLAALEGLMLQWVLDSGIDLDRCAAELTDMFDGYVLAA
jgi:TetR/AcrR family transcriptional regulator, fatty acid metabolism regulator protein